MTNKSVDFSLDLDAALRKIAEQLKPRRDSLDHLIGAIKPDADDYISVGPNGEVIRGKKANKHLFK
jgi:hypothetical protein